MTDPAAEAARKARRTRLLLLIGAIAPCAIFLVAMAGWIAMNGMPDEGKGMLGGVLTLIGIVLIGACYWLAERYWINPRK